MAYSFESGIKKQPLNGMIYGTPGAGKTLLACQAEAPLVLDVECGSHFYDVNRIRVTEYNDIVQFIKDYCADRETFSPFKTLIIDSATELEKICQRHICQTPRVASIEDIPFGKGHGMYKDAVKTLFRGFKKIREETKTATTFVGHEKKVTVSNPTRDMYEKVEFHLDKNIVPILAAELDFCFLYQPVVRVVDASPKGTMQAVKRGREDGTRELITKDRGSALAKSRFRHIPEKIEFPEFEDFEKVCLMYRQFWSWVNTGKLPEKHLFVIDGF